MRNFLYNKSDILIAIVIIAVAAIIIWTRVDAIMGTPDEGGKDLPTVSEETSTPGAADVSNGVEAPPVVDPNEPDQEEGASTEGEDTDAEEDAVADGETVEFTVEVGSAASTVANDLEAQGLVDSADAFIKELEAQNAVTKLKAGTFKIKSGASIADIVKKLTN